MSMLSKIYGTEPLPGQMLNLLYINVIMPLELRRFLCEWYAILYEARNIKWKAEYFQEGCDSLLAVHRILCRATKFRNIMLGKQKYLLIIPLNRRFNL